MDLDLRQILRIARRRWWIVILLTALVGGSAYGLALRETPIYSATATMMVNPGSSAASYESYNAILTSERLAGTYQQLITTQPVRERVAAALNREDVPASYSATAIDGSQLIRVTATGTQPETVALVANTVVTEFLVYTDEQAQRLADRNLTEIDVQIDALQQRQTEIDSELASLEGDEAADQRIASLQSERSSVAESLTDLNTLRITTSTQSVASSAQIQQVEEAQVPTVAFSPQPLRWLMLGLFVGALLGVLLIALLEFLDNTVKPDTDIQALAGAPLLATISNIGKLEPGGRQVYTMTQPQSAAAESLRLLRMNLVFASASKPIHSLTVSSASPGEGKSTTAANLGVVTAQTGVITVVIDADLRRPTLHRIFGVDNQAGLTTLLMHPEQRWKDIVQKVALPGLFLLPSGPIPPNPADLLSSDRFARLIDTIKSEAGLVIIDSPPTLSASDALAICQHTDGIVLVSYSGKTRTESLKHASDQIHQGGLRLIGVVLNRQKGQQGASYYGDYYGASPSAKTVSQQGD